MANLAGGIRSKQWVYRSGDSELIWVSFDELEKLVESGAIKPDATVGWDGLPGQMFACRDRNSQFFFVTMGVTHCAASMLDLQTAAAHGTLKPKTAIFGPLLPIEGVEYARLAQTALSFRPSPQDFLSSRMTESQTILCGRNNAGKSALLKQLRIGLGSTACLLSSNRFYHFDQVGYATDRDTHYGQRYDQFVRQLYTSPHNQEQSDVQLQQLIGWMTDIQRTRLWKVCSELLGEQFSLLRVDPSNELSPHYVDVGGKSLALASSGTRLLLGIVAACIDEGTDVLLIDEPEVGLSPTLQRALARFLFDKALRLSYFPHLKTVLVATHSHLFLDRAVLNNNFTVEKATDHISIKAIETFADFQDAQFALLGNELESLFLPAAIVVVEGITDAKYVRRLLRGVLPTRQIAVVNAKGDGGIAQKLHTISEAFGDLARSPYHDRILVLLDSRNSASMTDLKKCGLGEGHIQILNKNGIEHYYPADVLAQIFSCDPTQVEEKLTVRDSEVSCHGRTFSKTQLVEEVLTRMDASSIPPEEIRAKLIGPLERMVGALSEVA